MLFFSPVYLLGDLISWPNLRTSDYYRGTAGERLFYFNHEDQKGSFFIFNDLRNYKFMNYFDEGGDLKKEGLYSRFINIFSLNYMPSRKVILSLRVPCVNARSKYYSQYTYHHSGIGDIFFGVSYRLVVFNENKIFISTGLKLPTSNKFHDKNSLPIGTGSFDVPLIINSNFSFKRIDNFFDMGYIITGRSDSYPFITNEKEENGNELFFDYAIVKRVYKISLKAEVNYFYIFKTSNYYDLNDSKFKLSFAPGIVTQITRKIMIELGYSSDISGRNIYSANSLIFRGYYNF